MKKYYEAIPVSQLRVDPNLDAQRMFQPKWANRLAKIWDPGFVHCNRQRLFIGSGGAWCSSTIWMFTGNDGSRVPAPSAPRLFRASGRS
ncbi:hypothetical protein [Streptomyces sp. NPDC058773]|uniref:hypothetical protein n=1 Tax=Streptomyces sp. NPDC058773 TaxID=3346632 RepID=UPI0036736D44